MRPTVLAVVFTVQLSDRVCQLFLFFSFSFLFLKKIEKEKEKENHQIKSHVPTGTDGTVQGGRLPPCSKTPDHKPSSNIH